jgi:broad specificity phosphatase PhoE
MGGRRPVAASVCTMVLVRHAESCGAGKFVGQQDEPLSAKGRRQLNELARKLSRFRFHAIFASDLTRAIATARPSAQHQKLELQIRPGLREMHFGRWQGLSWEQLRRREPKAVDRWWKHFASAVIPGGERFPGFKRRVKTELRTIADANRGRCVLVVTHAGVIRVALADALGIKDQNIFRLAVDPCGLNVVDDLAGWPTVRCVNA